MKIWLKRLIAWFVATLVCTGLAAFFSSQRVLSALPDPQGQVGLPERLSTAVYDIQHFGTLYGIFILVAFLIAFLVGGGVYHFAKIGRPIVYMVAGAIAMLVMLLLMKQAFFGVDIVAGARDGLGRALQMVSGAAGGYVFARLTRASHKLLPIQ